MPRKIRVLIVDDSATVRQTLTAVLQEDPQIEVIATAADPFSAARAIAKEVPDVITLDVEMPRMDGITFLRKLMSQHPIPVVMCSSLTEHGSETLMQGLPITASGIVIPQHMLEKFTSAFARRLNDMCEVEVEVRQAGDGDAVLRGRMRLGVLAV